MSGKTSTPDFGLYCALMEEIKLRVEYIERACIEDKTTPGKFVLESSYLHLRMICEVIAVGCFVAHGDSTAGIARKLQKHWSAERMVRDLANLNPNFFPRPVRIIFHPDKTIEIVDIDPNPMTASDFQTFYGRCGDQLHRGSWEKLIASTPAGPVSIDPVLNDTYRIAALLREHRIASADQSRQFVCAMGAPGQPVTSIVAGATTPPQPRHPGPPPARS